MTTQRNSGAGVWVRVGERAGAQHGVISRNQLRQLGMSEATIKHAIATGHLLPLFRGTFAVGNPRVGMHGRMLAATLACGDGSVVSHGTAAFLLGLWKRPRPTVIDVIAPVEAGRKIADVRRRHVPPPRPRERVVHHDVPCTSPSRTIVDVAGIVSYSMLRSTIEQAAVNGMLDIPKIDAVLDGPRRRGTRRLLRALAPWRRYSRRTRLRSRMEARLLPLLTEYDLPIPQCNEPLWFGKERFEIDFLWRPQRFAIETDGGQYHDNPEAEARDSHRNSVMTAAGWRIWRLRWEDLRDRPDATLTDLARRLHAPPPG